MHEWESLSHVRWECKYHVVIIPKYRRKVLLREAAGDRLGRFCGICAASGALNCWRGTACRITSTCA